MSSRSRRRRLSSSIAVALSLLGCVALLSQCLRADNSAATRSCGDDDDCIVGGVVGRCLARHVCAFVDQRCASGLRVAFHPATSIGSCVSLSGDDGAVDLPPTPPPTLDGDPPTPLDGTTIVKDSTVDKDPPADAAPCGTKGGACCPTPPGCSSAKLVCLENKTCACVGHLVAGGDSQCAVHPSGVVSCWGSNVKGQLALAASAVVTVPTRVSLLNVALQGLALGGSHGCAISNNNTQVLCWGDNSVGQLGRAGAGGAKPTPVTLSIAAKRITAGRHHTCAIDAGGAVYCWGDNQLGQLSNAVKDKSTNVPTRVSALLAPATQVTAGATHTCAATASSVYCWGENGKGQLGTGNFGKTTSVEQTKGLGAVKQLSAGANHTCALASAGIYCWGDGTQGQTAGGAGTGTVATPALVVFPGGLNADLVVAGDNHTCAIVGGGHVYCWGLNDAGQVGLPTAAVALKPVPVLGVQRAVALSLGAAHTCALTLGGTVICWGDNKRGQLGEPNIAPGAATKPAVGCF